MGRGVLSMASRVRDVVREAVSESASPSMSKWGSFRERFGELLKKGAERAGIGLKKGAEYAGIGLKKGSRFVTEKARDFGADFRVGYHAFMMSYDSRHMDKLQARMDKLQARMEGADIFEAETNRAVKETAAREGYSFSAAADKVRSVEPARLDEVRTLAWSLAQYLEQVKNGQIETSSEDFRKNLVQAASKLDRLASVEGMDSSEKATVPDFEVGMA